MSKLYPTCLLPLIVSPLAAQTPKLLYDINQSSTRYYQSSSPSGKVAQADASWRDARFAKVGSHVFFQAREKATGKELYVRAVIRSDAPVDDPSWEGETRTAWTQPVGWRAAVARDRGPKSK